MTHIRILRACKGNEIWRNSKGNLVWLLVSLIIFVVSRNKWLIERYFTYGFYPFIAIPLRSITGYFSFSVGDILYVFVLIYFVIRFIRFCRKLYTKEIQFSLVRTIGFLGMALVKVYVVFMVFWGLNYSREGIDKQLVINANSYDTASISVITNELIDSVNSLRKRIGSTKLPEYTRTDIVNEAVAAYKLAKVSNVFLSYDQPSVKETFFTPLADYIGFLGYYNPFSGEAQVRMDIPNIMIPFITCHEIAHQLGYAAEDQANFVGYLACSASKNPVFRYSVYLDLLSYAFAEQYRLYGAGSDFKRFEQIVLRNRDRMDALVRMDRKTIRDFFDKRRNNVAPVVSTLYDQYLRMNKQFAGIGSYDLVIKWLIAYKAKYGKI